MQMLAPQKRNELAGCCCRAQQSCRQQEAAREQLQYSIRTELNSRGWGLWPSGSLSSRIHRALQDDLPQGEMMSSGVSLEQEQVDEKT